MKDEKNLITEKKNNKRIMGTIYIIIFLFTLGFLFNSIKIVNEHERLVLLDLGRQHTSFRGPGIVFILPVITSYEMIKLGDSGTVVSQESAEFAPLTIPIEAISKIRVGDRIKITDFKEDRVIVTADYHTPTSYICKHCGKRNNI